MFIAEKVKEIREGGTLVCGEVGASTDEDDEKRGLRKTSVTSSQEAFGRCGESREAVGSVEGAEAQENLGKRRRRDSGRTHPSVQMRQAAVGGCINKTTWRGERGKVGVTKDE